MPRTSILYYISLNECIDEYSYKWKKLSMYPTLTKLVWWSEKFIIRKSSDLLANILLLAHCTMNIYCPQTEFHHYMFYIKFQWIYTICETYHFTKVSSNRSELFYQESYDYIVYRYYTQSYCDKLKEKILIAIKSNIPSQVLYQPNTNYFNWISCR